ncbi:MAG: hypothetical protein NTZ50_11995 [Chloroflexi bacterium]|nr:hypothetical protein [Chloroflexota bacterium]
MREKMRCLTIDLVLEEPVLCTQLDGEPNSARTFGFVPGAVLRGAFLARYAAAKSLADSGALYADAQAQQLFFAADVRYLNAYPLRDNARALPASQSWFRDKHEYRERRSEAPIYDLFVKEKNEANKRVAGEDDDFAVRSGDSIRLHKVQRQVAIHTMRDREAGRATERFGAVFRYEALAPFQTLRAHVLVGAAGGEVLQRLLTDDATLFLGKARTAGYGRVNAQLVSDVAVEEWREAGGAGEDVGELRRMTLLADAFLRDANGAYGAGEDALKTALADVTGIAASEFKVEPRHVAVRTVGGFNRTWGLPLPQTQAARMGSEYEVKCDALTAEQIRRLEALGIGERCADGFGRVAFAAVGEVAVLTMPAKQAVPDDKARVKVPVTSTAGQAIAKEMVERMLRSVLDRKLADKALEISASVKRPSVSQLKRLQAVVRDELSRLQLPKQEAADAQRLKRYMESIDSRASVRRMFRSGGFAAGGHEWLRGANDFSCWLNARFEEKAFEEEAKDIEKILGLSDEEMPVIGGVKAELKPSLRREYSLRLVHAVLGLAAKRQRRAGEEKR